MIGRPRPLCRSRRPKAAFISYAYLWRHERRAGREEATKDRPAAIMLVSETDLAGPPIVTVVPLTSREPGARSRAIELPARVVEHLGLSARRS